MPKVVHAIEGWALGPGETVARPIPPPRLPVTRPVPEQPGLWRYRTERRSRITLAFSILFSLGLHAAVFLGFNDKVMPVKRAAVNDDPVIQMIMPDLKEDEIDPVESISEEEMPENPSIAVPMLADLPSLVPIDSFVQPLDFTPALPANIDSVNLAVVPVNIARNSGAAERLGRIFNVAELDRQPQPIVQQSPVFPPDMKREYREAEVEVGFIITTKGEVLAPHVIKSANARFEDAAIRAILKWKFRPGFKSGRPVNTRTQITIKFRLIEDQ